MSTSFTFNQEQQFGIEIEAYGVPKATVIEKLIEAGIDCYDAGYTHVRVPRWKIVSDASIQPEVEFANTQFELVSPPLKGNQGLEEVQKVCQVLNTLGVKVNKSCGFHVHHAARHMSTVQLKNLFRLWYRFEPVTEMLVSPSRRNAFFCKRTSSWLGQSPRRTLERANRVEDLISTYADRYCSLNRAAYWRHGTIEFRSHQGTTDFEKISAWIILTQSFMIKAMQEGPKREKQYKGLYSMTWELGFHGREVGALEKKTRKFLKTRFEYFCKEMGRPLELWS